MYPKCETEGLTPRSLFSRSLRWRRSHYTIINIATSECATPAGRHRRSTGRPADCNRRLRHVIRKLWFFFFFHFSIRYFHTQYRFSSIAVKLIAFSHLRIHTRIILRPFGVFKNPGAAEIDNTTIYHSRIGSKTFDRFPVSLYEGYIRKSNQTILKTTEIFFPVLRLLSYLSHCPFHGYCKFYIILSRMIFIFFLYNVKRRPPTFFFLNPNLKPSNTTSFLFFIFYHRT